MALSSSKITQLSLANAIEMINLFQEGAILVKNYQQPILFNQAILSHYPELFPNNFALSDFELIIQKTQNSRFDLQSWLSGLDSAESIDKMLWLKSLKLNCMIPVQLMAHPLEIDSENYQLIRIIDLTLQLKSLAQDQLMEVNYAGQFIANQYGKITQPNQAFCTYTGLSADKLSQMTYLEWLKNQVSFNIPFNSVIKVLLKDHYWSGEVQVFTSETQIQHAILSLSMLLDPQKNIEHFIGVVQDFTEIRQAQDKIKHLAYYDKLTGLANRTLLHDRLEQALTTQETQQTHDALFFIDLDGFKIINDTFGHSMGDQLLLQIAQKLQSIIQPTDTLARVSGDEFIILRPMQTQDYETAQVEALAFASDINETLDDRYQIASHSVHSAASIGIIVFPMKELSAKTAAYRTDELTSFADMAMYEAKKLGGNQSFLFEQRLIQQSKQRLELIEALNHSELDEEFQIYFQAQVDQMGEIQSAETLLRWFHPELGLVSPGKFIPVAEEGRQIIKIGLWVLHKAFLQAKAWNKIRDIQISINISPIQFHEQSFVEIIIGLVKFTQVNPRMITLELTEGVLIRNANLARQKIQHLVSLGFRVSIDDFGTGYSSLSYLQRLPIHELKIDQAFIQQIPGLPDDEAIVDSIISLAQTKNLNVVAEGVETQMQAEYLIEMHPDVILQGFYYSKPIPAAQFEETFILPKSDDI